MSIDIATIKEIILLAVAIISLLGAIFSIISSIVKGELRKFVEEKMKIAEESGLKGEQKLNFVLEAVKEKFKLVSLISSARKIVEEIIDLSKKINAK